MWIFKSRENWSFVQLYSTILGDFNRRREFLQWNRSRIGSKVSVSSSVGYSTFKAIQIVTTHASWHNWNIGRWGRRRSIYWSTIYRLLLIKVICVCNATVSCSWGSTSSNGPRKVLKLGSSSIWTIARRAVGTTCLWVDIDRGSRRCYYWRWIIFAQWLLARI